MRLDLNIKIFCSELNDEVYKPNRFKCNACLDQINITIAKTFHNS